VKVSVVRGGGLGGFSSRTELDAAALPADAAKALEQKARAAAAASGDAPGPAAHPEDQLVELRVEDGAPQVLRFRESSLPEPVRALLEWVDSRSETTTSVER
jgi:hypothetical protein